MKSLGGLVAASLSKSWMDSSPRETSLSESQLDQVTPLLYQSGAAGLGWWRIRESALRQTASGEMLHQAYRLLTLQAAIHETKIRRVFHALRDADIEPILIKGWAAARAYPQPGLRPYGDIDLIVRPRDYQKAREISEKLRDCQLDFHGVPFELADRSIEELFSRSQLVSSSGEQIRILSEEDHLALLAIHLLKHGAWRPLWLCDIAVIVELLPEHFDWETCLGTDRLLSSWIAASIGLAGVLLKANIEKAPEAAKARRLPSWLREGVVKQWGNLVPPDHLPVQPRPLMRNSLSSPREILRETWERWPDSITATFQMRGGINSFPRLPYQLGAFSARAGHYLLGYLRAGRAEY